MKRIDGRKWLWRIRNRKNWRRGRPYWTSIPAEYLPNPWRGEPLRPIRLPAQIHPAAKTKITETHIKFNTIQLRVRKLQFITYLE